MEDLRLKIKRKCCSQGDVSWPTYILIVLFGLGSWIAVNGLWVELPLLVQHAPEKWKLPSIFAVVIQIANIGPVLYTVLKLLNPDKLRDASVIYLVLVVDIIGCALLGFLWDRTGYIEGNERSVALIPLVFFVAIADCTSSVTFLPFMGAFRTEYMSALFVGGGLSALIPSLLALGQGINSGDGSCLSNASSGNMTATSSGASDINFGVNVFFFGLMGLMIVSLLAFIELNTLSCVRREHVKYKPDSNGIPREAMAIDHSQEFELNVLDGNDDNGDDSGLTNCQQVNHWYRLILLLFIQAWINALSNGVVPSIQTYACIPYGYKIYHLTLTLSNIANPLAGLLFYWLPTKSILFMGLSGVVYTSLVSYILCAAALSATPPLPEDNIGASLIVSMLLKIDQGFFGCLTFSA